MHVSIGNLFRKEEETGSEAWLAARPFIFAGEPIPDEIVLPVVAARLALNDCVTRGWILEGAPTSEAQAIALAQLGVFPDHVIFLDIPEDVCLQRIIHRRYHKQTGAKYHLLDSPPPAGVNADEELITKKRDSATSVSQESKRFADNLSVLSKFYQDYWAKVNANQGINEVTAEVERFLLAPLHISNRLQRKEAPQ